MNKNRLLALILSFVFAFSMAAFAQDTPVPPDQQQVPPSNQKDKAKEKKKKKDKSQDVLNTDVFNDDVARYVLSEVRDGLEGHLQRLFLSAFDDDEMSGYLSFEDQIQAMFDHYSEFRVHFRILQTTVEGPKGVVLVDFELEEVPKSANSNPQRKSSQIRFELQRGRKGWRIVDFSPRGFFS
jgi:hypothetical protein